MAQRSCLICGADAGDVTVRLVEWREPIAGRRWETLPRCRDVEGCWERVTEVLGEEWPVNDGRPVGGTPSVPEPVPAADQRPADAPMEEPAWLVS